MVMQRTSALEEFASIRMGAILSRRRRTQSIDALHEEHGGGETAI
jgi:hypothetical protein